MSFILCVTMLVFGFATKEPTYFVAAGLFGVGMEIYDIGRAIKNKEGIKK